jgi:hypothetical protein
VDDCELSISQKLNYKGRRKGNCRKAIPSKRQSPPATQQWTFPPDAKPFDAQ